MENNILGIYGKLQSGKSSLSNYLHGLIMKSNGVTKDFEIDKKTGDLYVYSEFQYGLDDDKSIKYGMGLLDLSRNDLYFTKFAERYIWPLVKEFSFATGLKEFLIRVFGLSREQCYGTNEQKDTLTKVKWEDMRKLVIHTYKQKTGYMTGRELMQVFGSEICRTILPSCWVDACMLDIQYHNPKLAIIPDVRFENEAVAIQEAGGKIIKLTRSVKESRHKSEKGLDHWQNHRFNLVVNNQSMQIPEKNEVVREALLEWGFLPAVISQ